MKRTQLLARLILAILLGLPAAGFAAEAAGRVDRLAGEGKARTPAGVVRTLAVGDPIVAGERILTGERAGLQIEFSDKSRFILGPNAEFEVESYRLKRQDAGDEAFHSRMFKGAFRFVSGLIARGDKRSMWVNIRIGTIGVRGTHVEGEVREPQEKDGVRIDASAQVVLLEPLDAGAKTAIEVSNTFGSVLIDQPGYGTTIPDEKSPPSPVRRMQLHTIDNIQRALRSTVRQGGAARPRMP